MLGDCRDATAYHHIPGSSLLHENPACQDSSVFVVPSRWQLRERFFGHQVDSAGQTPVPGECRR